MRKLAVVLLIVLAGCRRQAAGGGEMGAASARAAVDQFMASARSQDLDAMGRIWGSSAGPAIATLGRQEREQREVILMRCLRHEAFAVLGETPSAGGEMVFKVELRFRQLAAVTEFATTMGPGSRWYVRHVDPTSLQQICTAL